MRKISIAIIDNNLLHRNMTHEMILEYIARSNLRVTLNEFDSGDQLLREILRGGKYDIYIMEVTMPDMNGIILAEKLRSDGDNGKIIYLTKDPGNAYRAFQVRASDYLLKPLVWERLSTTLDMVLDELNTDVSPIIEIKFKAGLMRVPIDSIIYVDVVDRALCFHLKNGRTIKTSCIRSSFREDTAKVLGTVTLFPDFVYAGRSHLLNVAYIVSMNKEVISLTTGEQLPIPVSAVKTVLEAWRRFRL